MCFMGAKVAARSAQILSFLVKEFHNPTNSRRKMIRSGVLNINILAVASPMEVSGAMRPPISSK